MSSALVIDYPCRDIISGTIITDNGAAISFKQQGSDPRKYDLSGYDGLNPDDSVVEASSPFELFRIISDRYCRRSTSG